ncbi:MAG: hypothetical protein GY859_00585 [Desulfobacterales bacterium]|nr:hypothetical protein [Desulfobacterales bacterium]
MILRTIPMLVGAGVLNTGIFTGILTGIFARLRAGRRVKGRGPSGQRFHAGDGSVIGGSAPNNT